MPESSFTLHAIEFPPAGETLAPGRQRVQGWVMLRSGGSVVDVRAWAHGRLFPGVHGIPRSDPAIPGAESRPALVGFFVELDLTACHAEIVLEALTLAGEWRAFARSRHRVDATLPPAAAAVAPLPYRWHDVCRGLDPILRAGHNGEPGREWKAVAHRFAAAVPFPRDMYAPPSPFIGFLDEPAATTTCRFGRTPVGGHLFHPTGRIVRILASADLQILQSLKSDLPRPDVGAAHARFPTAASSGYFGFVDVPSQLPAPTSIRLYAELADGSIHLVHALRTRLQDAEGEKFGYPHPSPGDFDAAYAAWREALAVRGIPVLENAELTAGTEALRANYLQRGARTVGPGDVPPLRSYTAHAAPPATVLLVTHNLNFEGAPLIMLEYGRALAAAGTVVRVVSPLEGPLRSRFEGFGASVMVIDVSPVFLAGSAAETTAALASVNRRIDYRASDLVVCNTFTTFWAVAGAKAAGRRVLLYIHESTTPAGFYAGRVPAAVVREVETAFTLADAVSFTAAASRRYHLEYGRPETHRFTPPWIDLPAIDRWLAANPRAALRARFGLGANELLVTNVGTISARKGQHLFVRAVALFCRDNPLLAARTRFILVGAGDSEFAADVQQLIAATGGARIELHPETADNLPYFAAADLTVCSSYEESSPRVILEGMACGTPLLASAVHGIPELVRPDLDATLVPAGDTVAWSHSLRELLLNRDRADGLARSARARVEQEFSTAVVLPRHLALAGAVTRGEI